MVYISAMITNWLSNFSLVRVFIVYRWHRRLNVERVEAIKLAAWVVYG
jgi:hypothetical protein